MGQRLKVSLAYSHGCLFVTNSDDSESSSQNQGATPLADTDTSAIFSANIHLYCVDTSTWKVSQVTVPSACLMPIGHYYTTSSLIEFPDGRIGKVSEYMTNAGQYISSTVGGYTSVLRTYTVSGTGSAATIACLGFPPKTGRLITLRFELLILRIQSVVDNRSNCEDECRCTT